MGKNNLTFGEVRGRFSVAYGLKHHISYEEKALYRFPITLKFSISFFSQNQRKYCLEVKVPNTWTCDDVEK